VRDGADPPEQLETVDDVVRFLVTCPRYYSPGLGTRKEHETST
jgi:hypothetical protein